MSILDKLFGGKSEKPEPTSAPPPPEELAAEILQKLINAYADERGVHAETLLSCVGALAGFGCQIAIRDGVKLGLLPANTKLTEAQTDDGRTYFFGDSLNQPLLEADMSVWNQVMSAAHRAGATQLPDMADVASYVAGSVGQPYFGTIRIEDAHQPHEKPIDALAKWWLPAYNLIKARNGDPLFIGWYFATAAQQLIAKTKAVLDPALAARIVIESAVAMAKVDPRQIGVDL